MVVVFANASIFSSLVDSLWTQGFGMSLFRSLPVLALISALLSGSVDAQIYRWTDASGKLHYSDSPPKNASAELVNRDELPLVHRQKPEEWSGYYSSSTSDEGGFIAVNRSEASLSECLTQKRYAIAAEKRRDRHRAEQYDSWIWKNCKGYTDELRQLAGELD